MDPNDSRCLDMKRKDPVRGRWLVSVIVVLAVYIELLPFEADLMYGSPLSESVLLALAAKVTCLTLILLPLVIYVLLNGVSALKYVRGRVTVVAVIVAIKLAHDFLLCFLRKAR